MNTAFSNVNLYKILNVSPNATVSEIKQARNKCALKQHTDKGGNVELMKAVNEAYSVLSNPERRRQYDANWDNFDDEMTGEAAGFLHTGRKLSDEFKAKIHFWQKAGPPDERMKFCNLNHVESANISRLVGENAYQSLLQSEKRSLSEIMQQALPADVWLWSFSPIYLLKKEILNSPLWTTELPKAQPEQLNENVCMRIINVKNEVTSLLSCQSVRLIFPNVRHLVQAIYEYSPYKFTDSKTHHKKGWQFELVPNTSYMQIQLGCIPKYTVQDSFVKLDTKATQCLDCKESFGFFLWRSNCMMCGQAQCNDCLKTHKILDYTAPVQVCHGCEIKINSDIKACWTLSVDDNKLRPKLTANYIALVDELGFGSRLQFLSWAETYFEEGNYDLALQCTFSGQTSWEDWSRLAAKFMLVNSIKYAKICLDQIRWSQKSTWIAQADALVVARPMLALLYYQKSGMTPEEYLYKALLFGNSPSAREALTAAIQYQNPALLHSLHQKALSEKKYDLALTCAIMGQFSSDKWIAIIDAVEIKEAALFVQYMHQALPSLNWRQVRLKSDRDHLRWHFLGTPNVETWLDHLVELLQKDSGQHCIPYFRSKMQHENFICYRDQFLVRGLPSDYLKMAICHRMTPNSISWEELAQKWRSKSENGSLAADLCGSINISQKADQLFAEGHGSLALRYYLQAGNYRAIKEKATQGHPFIRLLYQTALWRKEPQNLNLVLDIAHSLSATNLSTKHSQSLLIAALKCTRNLLEGLPYIKLLVQTGLTDQQLLGLLDMFSNQPSAQLTPQDKTWYEKTVASFQAQFKNSLRTAIYQYAYKDVFAKAGLIHPLTQPSIYSLLAELKIDELSCGTFKSLCLMVRSLSQLISPSTSSLFSAMNDITEAILGDSSQELSHFYTQILEKIAAHMPVKVRGKEMTTLQPARSNEFTDRLVRSPDLRMFIRADEAIANFKPLDAAMSYIDLSMGARSAPGMVGCFLNAAFSLGKELEQTARQARIRAKQDFKLESKAYAYRRAITELVATAYVIGDSHLCPATQLYMLRSGIAILTAAFEDCGLISSTEQKMLDELQMEVDRLSKVAPLIMQRLLQTYDLVYLSVVQQNFMGIYLDRMRQIPEQKNPSYQYYLFEGTWKGWIDAEKFSFEKERMHTMQMLLKQKGKPESDVEALMNWPAIPRDASGWMLGSPTALRLNGSTFACVKGIRFNLDNGEISLLFESSTHPMDALFDMDDVKDVLQLGIVAAQLTLDPPDSDLPCHPFQEMLYAPNSLAHTNFLATMLHADLLLKQLSMNVEISSSPPFALRSAEESLLKRLPAKLRTQFTDLRKKLPERGGRIHRFWIEADELPYFIERSGNEITYTLGKCKMLVRKHLMVRDPHGKLVDSDEIEDKKSPEAKFAKLMTKNYRALGKYYPELARLEELVKLQALSNIVQSIHQNMQKASAEFTVSEKVIEKRLENIRKQIDYPLSCNEEDLFAKALSDRGWVRYALPGAVQQEMRNTIRNNIQLNRAHNAACIKQVSEILCKEYETRDLDEMVKLWLDIQCPDLIWHLKYTREWNERQKILRICKTFQQMGIATGPQSVSQQKEVHWVPAAFRKGDTYRVYGGVNMNARMVHGGPGNYGGNAPPLNKGGQIYRYEHIVRMDSGGRIYGTNACVDPISGNTYAKAFDVESSIRDQWNRKVPNTQYFWRSYVNPYLDHYTHHHKSDCAHAHYSKAHATCIDPQGKRTDYNPSDRNHKCT